MSLGAAGAVALIPFTQAKVADLYKDGECKLDDCRQWRRISGVRCSATLDRLDLDISKH